MKFRNSTAIVGIGYSRSTEMPSGFSKNSGVSVMTLALRAVREACGDAGISPRDIDGAITYQLNDSVLAEDVLRAMDVKSINYAATLFGGGRYSSTSTLMMAQAVSQGSVRYGLVFRALNGRSGARMGQVGAVSTSRIGGPEQFTSVYGLAGPPSLYAAQARRYMDMFGATSEDFGSWAVNSRRNALANPRATMRQPITLEDHHNSRTIVDPYRLLDCCLETDMGVALIVATSSEARNLRKLPILISAGIGCGAPYEEIVDTGLRLNGRKLLDSAEIDRSAIDIFYPYDNFSDCALRLVEDMGWCGRGEAGAYVREGRAALDGEVPMNTQGGLLSEGYGHGMNNLLEAVQQLRGEAEDMCPGWHEGQHSYDRAICRQVRAPEIAMHCSVVGTGALILQRG